MVWLLQGALAILGSLASVLMGLGTYDLGAGGRWNERFVFCGW